MTEINLEQVSTDKLFEFLGSNESLNWKRTWTNNEKLIGVFEYDPYSADEEAHAIYGDGVVILIAESDSRLDKCKIWIHEYGGYVHQSNRGKWPFTVLRNKLIDGVLEFADRNDWDAQQEHKTYRGQTCPYCFAVYVYKPEDFGNDGKVVCQYCGTPFLPQEDELQRNDSTTNAYPSNDWMFESVHPGCL